MRYISPSTIASVRTDGRRDGERIGVVKLNERQAPSTQGGRFSSAREQLEHALGEGVREFFDRGRSASADA